MASATEYRDYGRGHGTAFFITGESASEFLDYMEKHLKQFAAYFEGFCEGLTGKHVRQYRHMVGAGIEFQEWANQRAG